MGLIQRKTDVNLFYVVGYQKVLTSKLDGERVSKRISLKKRIKRGEIITLKFPDTVWAVNPSFFEGLLKDAITKYGVEKVKKQVMIYSRVGFNTNFNEALARLRMIKK